MRIGYGNMPYAGAAASEPLSADCARGLISMWSLDAAESPANLLTFSIAEVRIAFIVLRNFQIGRGEKTHLTGAPSAHRSEKRLNS
jgi:hypothetical protein